MTSQGSTYGRFDRAISRGDIYAAELAAIELGSLSLASARALLGLYAEKSSPKYERAALRYLTRYLAEAAPSLEDVAQIAALLVEQSPRSMRA